MKKVFSAILVISALFLTGCGAKYDFTDKELTKAIGTSKSVIDSLDIAPADDGFTGVELMEEAKNMAGADFYTYAFEQGGDSFDIAELGFSGGKVCSVELAHYGEGSSDYTVMGIHVGDSSDKALNKGKEFFGAEGSWLSETNPSLYDLGSGETDILTFGDYNNKKGVLTVRVDTKNNVVYSVEYEKF